MRTQSGVLFNQTTVYIFSTCSVCSTSTSTLKFMILYLLELSFNSFILVISVKNNSHLLGLSVDSTKVRLGWKIRLEDGLKMILCR